MPTEPSYPHRRLGGKMGLVQWGASDFVFFGLDLQIGFVW